MPSFSLVIEYLTGYCVATDAANREMAEWPPHPARIFMAMVAAHFETDPGNSEHRTALQWLSELNPPNMKIPQYIARRDVLTSFVPVNDMEPGKLSSIEAIDWVQFRSNAKKFEDAKKSVKERMGTIPNYRLNKQPRTFPRIHVGDQPVCLMWTCPAKSDSHLEALESICRQVTRIGHSSSLVWVRLEREAAFEPTHFVDPSGLGVRWRTPFGEMLQTLQHDYKQELRDSFERAQLSVAQLQAEIVQLEAERKLIKGKGASTRKQPYTEQIELKKAEQTVIERHLENEPPAPIRPTISHTTSYISIPPVPDTGHSSIFDPNFIVLKEADESNQGYGLESTAMVTGTLRKLIMSKAKEVPSWVGGHEANGDKLKSQNHMALIPLPFVGGKYGDGHLMGLGIVLPREVSYRERARVLSSLLFNNKNELETLVLTMGRAGTWKLVRETDYTPKHSLQTSTYTTPSLSWASVSPVLLDRMPKTDRVKEPISWREEVAGIIALSCQNVGLPAPVAVRVEKTPFFRGSLRAMPGQGGFPQLRKGRFQVHVHIEFDRPVQGPLLLGTGRFFGYGLMRPWKEGQ